MAPSGPISALERFIQDEEFPCVGAKAALNRDALTIVEAEAIDSAKDDLDIFRALTAFGEGFGPETSVARSKAHEQFERLRADGRYDAMKETIRTRDEELAGDINPMLDEFGESSEASQYSGRAVGPDWDCPFGYKEPEEPKGSDR